MAIPEKIKYRLSAMLVQCILAALPGIAACGDGVPHISGRMSGAPQVVFDTGRDGCEEIDIPDAPARAFRDAGGRIHLFASHYVARAMTGPNLNEVSRDCRIAYRSPKNIDPAEFQYKNWLYSFYTIDGTRVVALVHSEFDADEIAGSCQTSTDTANCWWNTITFAESRDGGRSFKEPPAPRNLVAALPYRYSVGNRSGAYGFNMPSNILQQDGFYYALINDWPYRLQRYGPCLIRTRDVFDPGSWRGWDGTGFNVRFADPYREHIEKPAEHVCWPVLAGTVECLVRDERSGMFIATQYAADDRFDDAPGFYLQASRDLFHWSKPVLMVRLAELKIGHGTGQWSYGYESLLDPHSADRNFSTIADAPYLYYIRSDQSHPPYVRTLFRQAVRIEVGG